MDNISVFPNRAAIKEEAGAWIVRLDSGELSGDEVQQLRNWMQQSDFHREYLLKLVSNWDAMDVLQELGEMFPLAEKEEPHSAPPGSSKLRHWIGQGFSLPLKAVACGLTLVLVAFLTSTVWPPGSSVEYVTAIGERRGYTLEDGTLVSLNTNTRILVDYSEVRRAVTLVQGEATFDVSKNPEKPFVVYAGTGLVWAVGTAFNVRHDSGLVDVIVTEGRVKVFSDTSSTVAETPALEVPLASDDLGSAITPGMEFAQQTAPKQREALLGAGETIRYREEVIESMKAIEEEESLRILAWHDGSLVFKGETLEQAIAEISRYTDKQLIIADADLRSLRVGGHYKLDDIDALLGSLGQGLGISVNYATDNRVLLSAVSSR